MRRKFPAIVGAAAAVLIGAVALWQAADQPPAPLTASSSLAEITHRMANAHQFYNAAEVTFERRLREGKGMRKITADLSVRWRPSPGLREEMVLPEGRQLQINDGQGQLFTLNRNDATYHLEAVDQPRPAPSDLLTRLAMRRKAPGQPEFPVAPLAPTSPFLSPLMPATGALQALTRSNVKVTGPDQMLGRSVLVLVASLPGDERKYWVDTETGVLLKEEVWENGQLVDETVVTRFRLNPDFDPDLFRIEVPAGARPLPPRG